ncbi:MAG: GspH/FimT family pseudopilin, partial [Rhodopirellula bahusiensis]
DGDYRMVIDMLAAPGVYSDGTDTFGSQATSGSSTWMVDPIALHTEVNLKANASSIQFTPTGTASRDLQMKVSRDTEAAEIFVQASSGNIYKDATP